MLLLHCCSCFVLVLVVVVVVIAVAVVVVVVVVAAPAGVVVVVALCFLHCIFTWCCFQGFGGVFLYILHMCVYFSFEFVACCLYVQRRFLIIF